MTSFLKQYIKKPSKTFIIVNACGWFFLFLLNTAIRYYISGFRANEIILSFILFAFCFLLTIIIRNTFAVYDIINKKPLVIIIFSLLQSFVAPALLVLVLSIVTMLFMSGEQLTWKAVVINFINLQLFFLLWMACYVGFKYFTRAKENEINSLKIKNELHVAQLNLLKGQLKPHFMFNSLNNIRSLILEDVNKARDMITNLSELLRYSLNNFNVEKVVLENELEIVNKYIEILAIQYEDRLKFSLEHDTILKKVLVPSMIIQMLVENAVKHGVNSLPGGGGEIKLNITGKDKKIVIAVKNTIIRENKDNYTHINSTGIGIENIKERLRLLYTNNAEFSLKKYDGYVEAKVVIPREVK
ncbi:MAG: histidine kinase [Ignavibacteria bacterium]|jgi:LytS/YehU family sensor histidine kinase